ncbi:hypothetical protein NDU88_002632 [Pleurodeles waltl]|uniref:Uncharacterized protein n=1 Tax=Pleurodeles waltl TaxID=8319 RepID=A0AAV7SB45_PLEWA|nr:hypothetical protein NDU88_002632 [Pleurodeles waltl]
MPQPPGYDVNTKRSYSWGSFQFQRRSSTAPKRLHCRIARSHRSAYGGLVAGGAQSAGTLNCCSTPGRGDLRCRLPRAARSGVGPGPQGSAACRAQVTGTPGLAEAPEGLGCPGLLEEGAWETIAPLGEKRSLGSFDVRGGGGRPPGRGATLLAGRAGPAGSAAWIALSASDWRVCLRHLGA